MNDSNLTLDEIALALAEMAGRLGRIEQAQESLSSSLVRDREIQRQALGLLVQLLERQTDSLKRIEAMAAMPPQEPSQPRRQAVVKGQVMVARPKAAPIQMAKPALAAKAPPAPRPSVKPKEEPPLPPASEAEPEIEQQISEAIGSISAMLKKKETRRRKSS
ncbi:hypothetical protein MTBLM1_70293 [Rhodospirillaceae bacterium LM-1]|nr:hypothetical protein MTBLM1_70293 [Rhodospirillaceae bacterium LM-1]